LKHCVRSQIIRHEYSTYNSHHKVLINLQASNMDAVKDQYYGLYWPTQSDLLSLKEYATNCTMQCLNFCLSH